MIARYQGDDHKDRPYGSWAAEGEESVIYCHRVCLPDTVPFRQILHCAEDDFSNAVRITQYDPPPTMEDAMATHPRIIIPLILLLWRASATVAQAQSEMERERRSLRGVKGFYLSLNTVGDASVQDSLNFEQLHHDLRTRLKDAGLPVKREGRVTAKNRTPYLHVHVNIANAGEGLYPFGIEIWFYQAVRLERDKSTPTVAVTWATSIVGVASFDQIGQISKVALNLLEDFIEDFQEINP